MSPTSSRRNSFRLVRTDVTDYLHVAGDVDLVLHFASPASPADYLRLPIETMKVGSIGTLHALGLAKDKGARFVLASTSEAYGDPQVHPQPEDYWGHVNPVGPRGVYDEAKRFAEALTTAYRTSHGTDTAIVRIFNTYGPRMRAHDGRAIPTFLRQALDGEPLTVAGDGRQTRSVCYVDDTVSGSACRRGERVGRPGQRRLSGGADRTGDRPVDRRGHGIPLAHHLHRSADRRPHGAPARHQPDPARAGLAAAGQLAGRAERHHRGADLLGCRMTDAVLAQSETPTAA